MEVPTGFLATLWSLLKFLPFFFSLLILGNLKACVIGPVAAAIIGLGNSAVIIGLWPAHFIWTYYCILKTERLGVILKLMVLILLPIPLLVWPMIGVAASFLGGIGYGYFSPLIATFQAVGENVSQKFNHCFVDGIWSTLEGSFTTVRDLTDFCFHSYFSFMDELAEKIPSGRKPIDIKLSRLPGSLLVILLAVPVDVIAITGVALWKSPYMLYTGWKRLLEDLLGREGPFLESVCVPFAGLAIILWPAAVVGAVLASFLSSFFLGLYSGVVVHQECSVKMGFSYIVSIISLFDEYVNDLLYLREGSCVPRPRYRRHMRSSSENSRKDQVDALAHENRAQSKVIGRDGSDNHRLTLEQSRTLKTKIHNYRPIQVLDWLFKSCEVESRVLIQDGLIDVKDIEDCVKKGNCTKLGVKLPAWCILKCLLVSAKLDSPGLAFSNEEELRKSNWRKDKVGQWFIGPLLVMKEQIKGLNLEEGEEACLREIVMKCENERPEDWDDTGFPSDDSVRRAQLQAIIRRLQGIVKSMSRMPTFRRRFQNLVKVLYLEAARTGDLANYIVNAGSSEKRINMEEGSCDGGRIPVENSGSIGYEDEIDGQNIV